MLECPYCDKEIDDPDDCYEPEICYEHECPFCEKSFAFTIAYERIYSANKADCLNGGEHAYKDTRQYGFPGGTRTFKRCADCGHEVHNAELTGRGLEN